MINSVELVENQQMPTFGDYFRSIPSLFAGDATLPKPIGADTKVPDLPISTWSSVLSLTFHICDQHLALGKHNGRRKGM